MRGGNGGYRDGTVVAISKPLFGFVGGRDVLRAIISYFRKHAVNEVTWGRRIAAAMRLQGFRAVPEAMLPDSTRVDVLMDKYAIEINLAEKWAECIGQALYHSHMTARKPV